MRLTDEQKALLLLLREADEEVRGATEKREDHLRGVVESGAPFEAIGRSLGVTGRAVARLAQRRGWVSPREYARRG